MSEQSWRPVFRHPRSTVTRVLRSPAFLASRERAGEIVDDPAALRALADEVEILDHTNAPLSAISDRVAAAVNLLRALADDIDAGTAPVPGAGRAARERLVVSALHYLVTPVDLIPDFRVGGYIDDVLLLSWVFGSAVNELEPYLVDESDG